MTDFIVKMAENLELDNIHGFGGNEISGWDPCLAQIGLDPAGAKTHPLLHKKSTEELEVGIDAIYAAARSGNQWAEFLIHGAAMNQLKEPGLKEREACLGGYKISEDEVSDYESERRYQQKDHQPIANPFEAILELDKSLLTIELIIENSRQADLES